MAKHRIAILSDTHGLLRQEVITILNSCEVIFHGGDINNPEIVQMMREIAPLYVVRGNNDKEWAENLPMSIEVDLWGFRFFMCHKKKDISELQTADFIIYGHSHKYEVKEGDSATWINPGSCGPRRFHQPVTMAVLTVQDENHSYNIEMADLSPVLRRQGTENQKLSPKDLDKIIESIIKDIDAGKDLNYISKKNRVEIELAESICRIYSTHPGIDIPGIIDRLELRKLYRD